MFLSTRALSNFHFIIYYFKSLFIVASAMMRIINIRLFFTSFSIFLSLLAHEELTRGGCHLASGRTRWKELMEVPLVSELGSYRDVVDWPSVVFTQNTRGVLLTDTHLLTRDSFPRKIPSSPAIPSHRPYQTSKCHPLPQSIPADERWW